MTPVKLMKRLEKLEQRLAPHETIPALDSEVYGSARLYDWVRNKMETQGGFDLSNPHERKMWEYLELAYARRLAAEGQAIVKDREIHAV